MSKRSENALFNSIAPVYNLFYGRQRASFSRVFGRAGWVLNLSAYDTALDVGCGPGALCSVLKENGLEVTGVDSAIKMLDAAQKRAENEGISFLQASVLTGLPFPDKHFDLSFASYVAHGLQKEERRRMYLEMARVTAHLVIIHDFNKNRGLLTSFIEWLERGDYFHFIHVAEDEMRSCVSDMKSCFSEVRVIPVDTRASWYVCTPG